MKPKKALIAIAATALLWGSWSAFGQQSREQAQRPRQASGTGQPALNVSSVTKDQYERWMTELSNWGRWGKDDERGGLNLITEDKRKQARKQERWCRSRGTSRGRSRPKRRSHGP